MSRQIKKFAAIVVALTVTGCANTPSSTADAGWAATTGLIPNKTIKLSPSVSIPLERMVFLGAVGAAVYLVVDPAAPNWEIEEAKFPDNHYYMTLRMRRYHTGGAGEAWSVFNKRAKELMLRAGFDDFRVIEYTESLESSLLGSQRVAQGVVALARREK